MNDKVQDIFEQALTKQASDIYFLPQKDNYLVKLSLANGYEVLQNLSLAQASQVINYLKYQANMSLSEKRRPQLGAWIYQTKQTAIFCRLSSVGDFWNRESLVVRLIYSRKHKKATYFFQNQLIQLLNACQKRGLIIFSGPVGSGKTTAMYQCAASQEQKQVLCIEDPIEIYEPKFLQLQVNDKAQMTYQELLKVSLRHHPDIFIIGEIRDAQTARAAVDAALSGHLVLTTLHAQGVYGIWQRLQSLGIEQGEFLQTIRLLVYQRLIPTISGELKVLFDILDAQDFFANDFFSVRQSQMSLKWEENLAKCQKKGWISQETYQLYEKG
ncbi:competence type IV pilus ATPase ComGA [Ligilactobacillus sp. Marseille-Q7487]|jgi:competence protein ComGA|uniref:competence type IV pilus ATPase ComGA n=1 Tax=Ligilactobacillus sp. Marseille-Q7487 TaxID=3022128 RepID=UPI0015B75AB0|nr:competence type IV pilus ATPase ComGA [Ligilactobacillus sp. Marseille-Q7487]